MKKEYGMNCLYEHDCCELLNGKIVGECDFEVEEIKPKYWSSVMNEWFSKELLNKSCLDMWQMREYLNGKNGYAIHIKNLHIFDEPKELREFWANDHFYDKFYDEPWGWHWVEKAPQNMMYVYDKCEKKILISIRPEWLCKILNGEKTIEVRKKVLKEML